MVPPRSRIALAAFLAISLSLLLTVTFALLLPASTTQAQSQPEALGSVRGVVRNAAGDPLPNITVTLRQFFLGGEYRQVTSNEAGVYAFNSLPSGTYALHFSDPNKQYATRYYVAADFAGDATSVNVNGNHVDNVNMELAPAGAISLTLQSTSPVSMTSLTTRLYRQTQAGTWLTYRFENFAPNSRHMLFDGLPVGNYRLCASISDEAVYRHATECFENAVPPLTEELSPDATEIPVQAGAVRLVTIDFDAPSQIQGTVLSPGGAPLAGIRMVLNDESGYTYHQTTSNSDGYFRFPLVPDGYYRLIYNAPTYEANEFLPMYYPNAISLGDAETFKVNATTHMSVTQRLRRPSTITGKVTLPGDAPVNYAYLLVFRQWRDGTYHEFSECAYGCIPHQDYDAATGIYSVTNLIPGNYRVGVQFYFAGAQSNQFQFYGGDSLETADTIAVGEVETVRDINFVVGEGLFEGVISGQVTAAGRPLPNIEVGLFSEGAYYDHYGATPRFTTHTDANGHYALEGLSAGYYKIGARDPDGHYAITFFGQDPTNPDDYPLPMPGYSLWYSGTGEINGINIAMIPGATIRGHVHIQGESQGDILVQAVPRYESYFDPYFNFPVAYADARTDATGYYEITGLTPGTYFLRAYKPYIEEGYFGSPLYYPGAPDIFTAQTITLNIGQTTEERDFWFYTTPTNFLPMINSGSTAASYSAAGAVAWPEPE